VPPLAWRIVADGRLQSSRAMRWCRPPDLRQQDEAHVPLAHGRQITIEDSEQAADVLGAWAEVEGVECEVDDLAVHHRPGDLLEPEPDELDVEAGYPHGSPRPGAER